MPDYTVRARQFLVDSREAGHSLVFAGQWFRWGTTHYSRVSDIDAEHEILYWWAGRFSGGNLHAARQTLANIRAICQREEHWTTNAWRAGTLPYGSPRDRWLAFQNGVVNFTHLARGEDAALVPPSRDYLSEVVLPYPYEAGRTCPLWERSILQWMSGQESLVSFLQEFAGYLLTPIHYEEIALFLQGSGSNGKSVFCDTLAAMLGKENVSRVSLEDFGDKFRLAVTAGKLVNISTETRPRALIPVALVRQIISGEDILVEQKNVQPYTCPPTARLIVAWNEPPDIRDSTDAMWRRMRLVSFRRQFLGEAKDPRLREKLLEELPGIFWWAVQGYRRYLTRGRMEAVPAIGDAVRQLRENADPDGAFLRARLEFSPGAYTLKEDLARAYALWCFEHDLDASTPGVLLKKLYRLFALDPLTASGRLPGGNRPRVVKDVRLKEVPPEEGSGQVARAEEVPAGQAPAETMAALPVAAPAHL